MKKQLSTLFLIAILLTGLSLLLYPSLSNYWNSFRQSQAITSYAEQAAELEREEYDDIWMKAVQYNADLSERDNQFILSEEQKKQYPRLLDLGGQGELGYIEIPAIKVALPIYHGTEESVLQHAVGHVDWSSLPVGGESSHCVLSGHRGLPSARLFTQLDKLVEGDRFTLRILNEVLTYEVDQILIVEPGEVDSLAIEEGRDYCTLVTCTPYSINTHRLLVRGHRIENPKEARAIFATADAEQIKPILVAPMLAIPVLLFLVFVLLISQKRKSKE